MHMDLELHGRRILVMGGSKGLGRATAEVLAREGARVVLTSRDITRAEASARALGGEGRALDTEDPASIASFVRQLPEERFDGVFVNTGGPPPGDFADLDQDAWDLAYRKLLAGPVTVVRAIIPSLTRGSAILFNTSTSVKVPIPGLLLSNVFRAAVAALAKSLAQDLAAHGIRVNVIGPGRFQTERIEELDRSQAAKSGQTVDAVRAAGARQILLGRTGQPEEFGRLAAFLLSPMASFVHGALVLVDGGQVRAL